MPSSFAAACALLKSRDAMAATSDHSPIFIPGITLRVAMDATPSIPHFTLLTLPIECFSPFALRQEDRFPPQRIGRKRAQQKFRTDTISHSQYHASAAE